MYAGNNNFSGFDKKRKLRMFISINIPYQKLSANYHIPKYIDNGSFTLSP